MLTIDEIEYYLPKNKISNKELLDLNQDWDIETIENNLREFQLDITLILKRPH